MYEFALNFLRLYFEVLPEVSGSDLYWFNDYWLFHLHAYCNAEESAFCPQNLLFSSHSKQTHLDAIMLTEELHETIRKKKRGFPLRRREQGSHSEYDNHVLNYVKSRCSPPSAGMSPLAQRNFIALPSFCCGDTGGQKPALTPWGHLLGSPPRHTLWLRHNFPVRRHKSLCRGVFVSRDKAWKREKKTIQIPTLKQFSLPPFIMRVGVSFVRTRW